MSYQKYTVTNTVENHTATMDVYVKDEFFNKFPELKDKVNTMSMLELCQAPYEMGTYMHNEKGPAWIIKNSKGEEIHKEYRTNGKLIVDAALISKIDHDSNFEDKFNKLIND